ncbi:unnamed protein product [Rhizoctonia solani]|uniref:Uncharacterized protein n=1 Tax=Rhizoctonia solani TaxID=456999 RepID=A0A8H3HIL3_9AGAM|nr:unnamed protein product [Rhizoctonia solani]
MSATVSTATSPTLFYDLIAPKPGVDRKSFPATDLIYKLLHHTGADVSAFRRNCQISYRLIEYARDLYDEINARILIAEESGSWEHYDAYYSAIDPLEEVLLTIVEITEIERDEYLVVSPLPPLDQPVDVWIKKFISDWQTNRTKIRESFQDLRTREELKGFITPPDDQNEIEDAKAHDDRTLLQNLLREIGDNESKVASDVPDRGKSENAEMVKKVKEGLQSALDYLKGTPKKKLGDDLGVLAIKSGMITYGVTEVMKKDEIKQHPEVYDRLYGTTIWKAAQKQVYFIWLATNIHDNLKENNDAPNLAGLDQIYGELEAALTGEVQALMPETYLKLFPLVGKIGRAYHAQSLFLASLCHKIATEYQKRKIYEAHDALEKALTKTIEAFMTAGELNNKPLTNGTNTDQTENDATTNGTIPNGIPKITGDYDSSCEKLYDDSIAEITLCYNAMKVENVGDLQKKLDDERTKDKGRLDLFKKRITKDIPTRGFVELTLSVFKGDSNGPSFHQIQAKVLQTARLSYIKWLAMKDSELKGAEFLYFETPAEKKQLELDDDIKPLVQDGKCTLHLIVKKEPGAGGN